MTQPHLTPTSQVPTPPIDEAGLSKRSSLIVTGVLSAITLGCLVALFGGDLTNQSKGVVALVLMLALVAFGVPVGGAMILSASAGIWAVAGWNSVANGFETLPFRAVASWPLTVLPMFIFMGIVLWRSGVTARLYDAARAWMNWMPGGLAVTTNVAGAGLAAVSGSTIGITYALGRLGIPEMLRSNYDPRLATGAVLMAGTGGQLLPPSILMVIYAGVAGTPVGEQLLAGVVPGLLLPLAFGLTIVALVMFRPQLAPVEKTAKVPIQTKLHLAGRTWPILAIMVIVVGGIFSGVFTATEAAAYGAAIAVIIAFTSNGLRGGLAGVGLSLKEAASATAGILLLMIGASFVTRMLSLSGLSAALVGTITDLDLSKISLLLLLIVVYLFLGMALDPMTMVILTVPLLVPVLDAMDINLLMFGAFVVLLGELAVVTPPVGMLSFIVHKIASSPEVSEGRKISLGQVFQSVAWFLPSALLILLLLVFFPEVATWLPGLGSTK